MWLLAYNGQTPVGWRWIMMMDVYLEPFSVIPGGNRCWRHHQNCGGPHKDPLDTHTVFAGRDHLVFATSLPHFCEQAVYNVHNSSQTVGGDVRIAFATFFPLLLTFNMKVLSVLQSGEPFNTDQCLLYVPNYLEFNMSVSEFMVLKIYNVKERWWLFLHRIQVFLGSDLHMSRVKHLIVWVCCTFMQCFFIFSTLQRRHWRRIWLWVVFILIA